MERAVSQLPSNQGGRGIYARSHHGSWHEGGDQESHGHWKTKEVFSFDDGLAEQQGPFLTVARPIVAALMNLDSPPNDRGEGGPDPEVVREMLEDALDLLDNANAHLNVWRQ